jgi:hypothetical protein
MVNTSGQVTSGYLSTADWITPLWSKKLYKPFGNQNTDFMLELLAQPNAYEIVGNTTGEHFEEDRFHAFVSHSGADVAPSAAGEPFDITVPAGQLFDGVPYVVAGNVLINSVTKSRFLVRAVAGATVKIQNNNPASTEGATSASRFAIYTDTRKEGSDGPTPQKSGVTSYDWYTQIIRTAASMSGTALTSELKAVDGLNGGKGGVYSEYTRQMEYRNLLYCTGALLFGAQQENTEFEEFSLGMTNGLDNAITQRGQNIDTAGADIDETQFYAMTDLLVTQGDVQAYTMWASKKRTDEIEVNFKDYLANTNLNNTVQTYAEFAFGSSDKIKGLESTFTFNKIILSGKEFYIRQLSILNDPTTYNIQGVTGNVFQDLAYLIPMGAANVQDKKGNSVLSPYVSVKNHSMGEDRYMRIWDTGAMSANNKTRKDELIVDCLTDFGYDFACVNSFGAFR